jgi:hypothetical protein
VNAYDAGTDSQGVNMYMGLKIGWLYECSTNKNNTVYIAEGVTNFSAGRGGISDYVLAGNAYNYSDVSRQSVVVGYGIAQVAAGTDANGNYMIDVLATNGALWEWRYTNGWSLICTGIGSIDKGPLDTLDAVQYGVGWKHNSSGWSNLGSLVVAMA